MPERLSKAKVSLLSNITLNKGESMKRIAVIIFIVLFMSSCQEGQSPVESGGFQSTMTNAMTTMQESTMSGSTSTEKPLPEIETPKLPEEIKVHREYLLLDSAFKTQTGRGYDYIWLGRKLCSVETHPDSIVFSFFDMSANLQSIERAVTLKYENEKTISIAMMSDAKGLIVKTDKAVYKYNNELELIAKREWPRFLVEMDGSSETRGFGNIVVKDDLSKLCFSSEKGIEFCNFDEYSTLILPNPDRTELPEVDGQAYNPCIFVGDDKLLILLYGYEWIERIELIDYSGKILQTVAEVDVDNYYSIDSYGLLIGEFINTSEPYTFSFEFLYYDFKINERSYLKDKGISVEHLTNYISYQSRVINLPGNSQRHLIMHPIIGPESYYDLESLELYYLNIQGKEIEKIIEGASVISVYPGEDSMLFVVEDKSGNAYAGIIDFAVSVE